MPEYFQYALMTNIHGYLTVTSTDMLSDDVVPSEMVMHQLIDDCEPHWKNQQSTDFLILGATNIAG